jgi:aspartate carbamoyltransferase catalytic subunit
MSEKFSHRHLTGIAQLSKSDILTIFKKAEKFLDGNVLKTENRDILKEKTVVLAFFENSTRTRLSFEIAAQRLGANVVQFQAQASSVAKGESLTDTLATIEAMNTHYFVMRHPVSGAAEFLKEYAKSSIINAGDGQHEHPTQALLDGFTLQQIFKNLKGKKICIVGDILHSRVARSNILLLKTLGAEVALCAPKTLLPKDISKWNCEVFKTSDEAVEWADAVNVLRLQRERMESGLLPSLGEFSKHYGIAMRHVFQKPELVILHPGPVNYGVEIQYDVANCGNSYIRQQVTNGVAIRMAILELLSENF